MNLLRFDSEVGWAGAVCSLWRDRLRLAPTLKMCLPTGTTPAAIYAEMARSTQAGLVSFSRAHIFALDEFGGLRSDDPGRTRNTLRRQLIDAIDLPPAHFHALDPDTADLTRHCHQYDVAIGGGFDLVLLGLGLNGHLGMNEPGSSIDGATRRVDLHETTVASSARYFTHHDLPRWGLTVGLAAILAAKEVWVIANGGTKADIVRRMVHDEIATSNPASLLRRHANCSLIVDAEAGRLLDSAREPR